MTAPLVYSIVGLAVFCIGLHAVIVAVRPLRTVLAVNVMSSGIFLFLVAFSRKAEGETVDPVPDAMVLTGIVVTVSATAFAVALIRRLASRKSVCSPGDGAEAGR